MSEAGPSGSGINPNKDKDTEHGRKHEKNAPEAFKNNFKSLRSRGKIVIPDELPINKGIDETKEEHKDMPLKTKEEEKKRKTGRHGRENKKKKPAKKKTKRRQKEKEEEESDSPDDSHGSSEKKTKKN